MKKVPSMPHSYVNCFLHAVFSTKGRVHQIHLDWQIRLWTYMEGIAKKNHMSTLAVGGTDNHVHILISLPPTLSISKALQIIKGGSSKWIHETFPQFQRFAWQEGYSAFSVSVSHIPDTIRYINNQLEHHKTKSFEEELIAFLKKHNIDYDERYL